MTRPSDLTVSTVTTFEGMEDLREFWETHQRHPNSDIDFCRAVIRHGGNETRPCVLVVRANDQPVALLAARTGMGSVDFRIGYHTLYRCKTRILTVFEDGLIGAQTPGVGTAIVKGLTAFLKRGAAHAAVFHTIAVQSPCHRAIRTDVSGLWRGHYAVVRKHWTMALPESYEEFLKRRKSKHRYWLKRIDRRLKEAFPSAVRTFVARTPEDVERIVDDLEAVASKTYQRGLGAGFRKDQLHTQLLRLAVSSGRPGAYVLYIKDKPIAYWTGSLYQGVYHLSATGYVPEMRPYEPGTVLFLQMIADLSAQGVRKVDFGQGSAGYKERFGDNCWDESRAMLFPPTPGGGFLNLTLSLFEGANLLAHAFLEKTEMAGRIKRLLRSRMAQREKNGGKDA